MKITFTILVIIAVLGVGFWLLAGDSQAPQVSPESAAMPIPPGPGEEPAVEREVIREITAEGGKFYFKPATLTARKGETVRLTFKNVDGMHDWNIDEFKAATKVIQAGQEETIEFVANKAGTFEYYCSVGNHRAMGMKGTFTITE